MSKTIQPTYWILGSVLTALGLGLAAVLFCFDPSRSGFYPICLFHQTTGLLCPGCGSLRALHQLLHGHLSTAFRFNPLLVLSLPVLGWFGLMGMLRSRRNHPFDLLHSAKWLWVLLAVGLAFSIWRNIPGTMFASLPR